MFGNIWRTRVSLLVLVAMLAITLTACCSGVNLEVRNDTGRCSGGPCTINVTYLGGTPFCFATVSVGGNQNGNIVLSPGDYTFIAKGSCFNLTGQISFPTAGGWWHRFYCGTDDSQAPQFELGR